MSRQFTLGRTPLAGPIEPGMNWYSTYIFISTQDSVTPYHMDAR